MSAFMQPQVWHGKFISVEVCGETTIIDASLFGETDGAGNWRQDRKTPWPATCDAWSQLKNTDKLALFAEVQMYLENPYYTVAIDAVEIVGYNRWGAMLSASGYMDRTDISTFDTEDEAWEHLNEMYNICRECKTEIQEEEEGWRCECGLKPLS